MSYLATGATGGAAQWDFVRLWAAFQVKVAEKFGVFRFANGDFATKEGKLVPVIRFSQTAAIHAMWQAVGDELVKVVDKRVATVLAAKAKLGSRFIAWHNKGKEDFDSIAELISIFKDYAIELDTQAWAEANVESSYERMKQALDTTTGGFIFKPLLIGAHAVVTGLEAAGELAGKVFDGIKTGFQILPLVLLGVGTFMVWSYIKKRQEGASHET